MHKRMCHVFIHVVECPPLKNLTNGHVMFTSVGAGAVATYSCNNDFDLTGNTVRICQANRQWSGYEPSCEIASSSGSTSMSCLYTSHTITAGIIIYRIYSCIHRQYYFK